eukprot:SAG11_NODE_4629_length_1827_cov_10.847801_1_plen_312_part_00
MYSGEPDISGVSTVRPADGDEAGDHILDVNTSLPSIHFKGDMSQSGGGGDSSASGTSDEGKGASHNYSVERDGVPRVTRTGIHLRGESGHVRFASPRCKKALLLTGIQPAQLQPRGREEFSLGAKLPAVVDRRFEAFEELRARQLQLGAHQSDLRVLLTLPVLSSTRRSLLSCSSFSLGHPHAHNKGVRRRPPRARADRRPSSPAPGPAAVLDARAKLPKPTDKPKKASRGDDTATLLKMEAAHKARILEAAQKRMKEVRPPAAGSAAAAGGARASRVSSDPAERSAVSRPAVRTKARLRLRGEVELSKPV